MIKFTINFDFKFSKKLLSMAIIWKSKEININTKNIHKIMMSGKYPRVAVGNNHFHVHRLLMMFILKRNLLRNEFIHHKNGNKLDSRINNLELITSENHNKLHFKGKKQEKNIVVRRIKASIIKRWPNSSLNKLK
jgi:hypothetical protein